MYRPNKTQLTIGDNLLHTNLPGGTLSSINKLIDGQPLEKILAKLYTSKVRSPVFNPLMMFKVILV